jgi:hypothetical protein
VGLVVDSSLGVMAGFVEAESGGDIVFSSSGLDLATSEVSTTLSDFGFTTGDDLTSSAWAGVSVIDSDF